MRSFSDFLGAVNLYGTSWAIVEIRSPGGFSLPASDGIHFYCTLYGSARIAGVEAEPVIMEAGDVRIVLRENAHAVRTSAEDTTSVPAFFRDFTPAEQPERIVIGDGQLRARVLCGKLQASFPEGFHRRFLPPILGLTPEAQPLSANFSRIETLRSLTEGYGSTLVLTRLASLMLSIMLKNHPDRETFQKLCEARDPILQALELVRSDPQYNWSVASLARRVGMSRSNFADRFSDRVGRTPMEVITEWRMQFAADLLRKGDLKVAEIGARSGYRSEAAFSRRFTQFHGVSPRMMRNRFLTMQDQEATCHG